MVHSRPFSGRLLGTLCIAASLLGCIEEAQWETPADQTLVIALESSPERLTRDSALTPRPPKSPDCSSALWFL